MIQEIRTIYNSNFSEERYQAFLQELYQKYNHIPGFRIAETPVFISKELKNKIFEACEHVIDVVCRPDIKQLTDAAISEAFKVPNEDEHTTFLQIDFGICEGDNGEVVPKLIEAQGFPSLYFYQHAIAGLYRKHFEIPTSFNHLFSDYDPESYRDLLKDVILGNEDPRHVVLIDIEPLKQNTQIDFHVSAHEIGIKVLCVSELFQKDRRLYYKDEEGNDVLVKRIYNRVIFDELVQRTDLALGFNFTDELDVEWVGHPNWFFRISKYLMPFMDSPYVPKTYFLNQLEIIPEDLSNYVLKPLFSFSGSGVIFDVTKEDIEAVENKANYILQEKVNYIPIIQTKDGEGVKVEIRIMLIWPKDAKRPIILNNLARLSKGVMIGVKYNKDKTWVGGSVGFFE